MKSTRANIQIGINRSKSIIKRCSENHLFCIQSCLNDTTTTSSESMTNVGRSGQTFSFIKIFGRSLLLNAEKPTTFLRKSAHSSQCALFVKRLNESLGGCCCLMSLTLGDFFWVGGVNDASAVYNGQERG